MKKRITFALLLLCCALVFSACSLFPEEEERKKAPVIKVPEPLPFEWATVTRGDLQLLKRVTAKFVPVQKAVLKFAVEGEPLDDMLVSVGDAVKAGQVLGVLELGTIEEKIADCERQIERTELQITQLEENRAMALKRQSVQYGGDSAGLAAAIEKVNAQYDASLSSLNDSLSVQTLTLETLQEDLDKRRIISPIDGMVTYVMTYEENTVSSLMDIAVIVADTSLSLFSASTEYWEMLPEGTHVTITVNRGAQDTIVTAPENLGLPAVERVSGEKGLVYLALTSPDANIEDNSQATFDILLDERKDVLLISEKAVSRAGDDYIVYYQNEDGMRAYKTVSLGLQADGMFEVLSGLSEGEAVILP